MPVSVTTNSPLAQRTPSGSVQRSATVFSGWPAKRLRKCSLQPRTSKPQFDGCSGAMATPRCASQRHPGAVGAEPRPAARRPAPAPTAPACTRALALPAWRSAAPPSPAPQPSQRCRMWKRTPAARRRCSQARSSGAAFMSVGKHAARAADEGVDAQARGPVAQRVGAEGLAARARPAPRARAVARQEGSHRLAVREVQPALAGEQELAPDRRHGVVEFDRHARVRPAPRRPSARPGRRRRRPPAGSWRGRGSWARAGDRGGGAV